MPCRDWGYESYEGDETRTRLDDVTRMLCDLCGRTEKMGNSGILGKVPGLRAWWKDHQERDARRMAEELQEAKRLAKKEAALQKLTAEEKKLLGLK